MNEKWLERNVMMENDWKWFKMNENEWKMNEKWMKMNEDEWKWMKMNGNDWKWMKMNKNEWKLNVKLNVKLRNGSEGKLMEMDENLI